jgi:threonine aldolase
LAVPDCEILIRLMQQNQKGDCLQIPEIIDLRSDTVTLPTEEMLEATRHAKLGDDYYGEDSTVNQLQKMAAEIMGKEAALLVSSGTQANLTSLMANCNRGELVILEAESHIYWYEVGGISSIAGLLPWPIQTSKGVYDSEELKGAFRPKNISFPDASLVCVENTHNRHGGTIIAPNQLKEIKEITNQNNVKLYMDGARIFNASTALNIHPQELAKYVDNLMFCLSKGLCCPVGSLIVGDQMFVNKARKIRKLLGGQMRQAGIIAASGIIALEKMVNRLKIDHENAKTLAEKISKIKGIILNPETIQTNMVIFQLDDKIDGNVFLEQLKMQGILALSFSRNKIRFVTHHGIERTHVEKTAATIEEILTKTIS